jgi:signal transduction histidine kinase/DNA-binding NarL/FixJ family response regulator
MSRRIEDARILVVDDEEANVDLLESMLGDEGYRNVVSTRDARQAVALYHSVAPDLVLLDLHMPHLDGFGVLREMRELTPADAFVPVLVLTADITPEAKQRALSEGAKDFLTKPLDATEALLRIRNLLETRYLHLEQQEARAAAELAERRASFLAEASRHLAASFDYHTTIAQVARLAVPWVADYCTVDVLEADGSLARLGCAHVDPLKEELLREITHFQAGSIPDEHPEMRALQDAKGTILEEITADMLERMISDPRHRAIVEELGPRSVIAVPLDVEGRVAGVLMLVQTESARRFGPTDMALAEELARRASIALEHARLYHAAQEATRARDDLLTIVAHDLRNPLNTIFMSTELLLELESLHQMATETRHITIIRRSAEKMNGLIQDLLDVKRMEMGQLAIEPRPVGVQHVVAEALELLRTVAESRGQTLEHAVPDDLPRGMADPGRIQQVISNLVGNALKFTPSNGRVVVSAEQLQNEIRVAVTDTGPGIAADQLPHVFGRYWQGTRADHRGIGLGLAIAKGIIDAHGGRIWVESPPGEGATFYFTLPTAEVGAPVHAS